eukprot:scaffold5.g793.t1
MTAARFDIAVKGDPKAGVLADCPFCHRALLTLEEKGVPYQKTFIDFAAKPDWLLEVRLVVVVVCEWVVDSGVIADRLEQLFPQPPLGTSETAPQVGGDVFPAFVQFLKAPGGSEEEGEKRAKLEAALSALNDFLAANGKPYTGGASVTATDCALVPKLYHMEVALGHFKGWQLPEGLGAVRRYIDAFEQRPSWQHTLYTPAQRRASAGGNGPPTSQPASAASSRPVASEGLGTTGLRATGVSRTSIARAAVTKPAQSRPSLAASFKVAVEEASVVTRQARALSRQGVAPAVPNAAATGGGKPASAAAEGPGPAAEPAAGGAPPGVPSVPSLPSTLTLDPAAAVEALPPALVAAEEIALLAARAHTQGSGLGVAVVGSRYLGWEDEEEDEAGWGGEGEGSAAGSSREPTEGAGWSRQSAWSAAVTEPGAPDGLQDPTGGVLEPASGFPCPAVLLLGREGCEIAETAVVTRDACGCRAVWTALQLGLDPLQLQVMGVCQRQTGPRAGRAAAAAALRALRAELARPSSVGLAGGGKGRAAAAGHHLATTKSALAKQRRRPGEGSNGSGGEAAPGSLAARVDRVRQIDATMAAIRRHLARAHEAAAAADAKGAALGTPGSVAAAGQAARAEPGLQAIRRGSRRQRSRSTRRCRRRRNSRPQSRSSTCLPRRWAHTIPA